MSNQFYLISIGCVFSITGIILFIKGIGKGESSKLKFFGAELESSASSLVIFVIGAVFIFYGTTKTSRIQKAISIKDQMDSIGTTGWIFLGYYDYSVSKFTEGPFYAPYNSPYKSKTNDSLNLNKGDVLILLRDRHVIIVNYLKSKKDYYLDPPLANLRDSDYTGVTLPVGTKVRIEDISITQFPNSPYAIWTRIRLE